MQPPVKSARAPPFFSDTMQLRRETSDSDKIVAGMFCVAKVPLPITPLVVLCVILLASLAVFLWITRTGGPDQ